jgi:2-polyprenyl-6-methoxyphenol hydroxylase-like FAD-dependent oxidoreductase
MTGKQRKHAVIVGAGIGGVTCALALARRGWAVTLLERSENLGEIGSGISIWPKAMEVLEDLGVAEQLRGEYQLAGQAGLRRPDGRWLVTLDGTTMSGPTMVHRARLHEALVAGLGDVVVDTGITVAGVRQGDGGAAVLTTDGTEVRGDIVIGADGLRSVVRGALHPGRSDVRYAGYTAYRGVTPEPPAAATGTGGETWGRGIRFGYLPLVDGRTYWYATANAEEGDIESDHHADVLRLLDGWHDPVPSLVAGTPTAAVLRNDVYDLRLPLAPFSRGHVALLGDAAHAMTPNLGRGACAAIEAAAALARLLNDHRDTPSALVAYDRERRPATTRLIRRSRWVGALGQTDTTVAIGIRDAVLGLTGRLVRLTTRRI